MAKKNDSVNVSGTEAAVDEPYLVDEVSSKKGAGRISAFFKSRNGKIATSVAGSALALTAAFGVGFSAGNVNHPGFDGPRLGQSQGFGQAQPGFGDHDGHHDRGQFSGQQRPQQQGPQQGQGFGDHDGDHGQFGPQGGGAVPDQNQPTPSTSQGTDSSATTTP